MSCTSRNTGNFVITGNIHPTEHTKVTMRVQAGVLPATQSHACHHDAVRSRQVTIQVTGAATCGAGLVLVAIGTFLPWFKSGAVLRSSYDTIGIARTLHLDESSPLRLALDAWTMVVPVVTLCVAAYAFGLRRTAATIAAILAIICGTIGGIAAVGSSGDDVALGIASTGPTVTAVGGVLALLGVIAIFAGQRTRATNIAGGEP